MVRPADDVPAEAALQAFDLLLRAGARWVIFGPAPEETAPAGVAIDGVPIRGFADLVDAVQSRPNKSVTVDYLRDGQRLSTSLVVQERLVDGEVRGRLGVAHSGDFSDRVV